MMDKLKIKLIYKWTKEFEKDILDSLFIYDDEQRNFLNDLADDLEICTQVYSKYLNLIDN